eukprot:357902-Chlamydomonas_euryale.AAC.18
MWRPEWVFCIGKPQNIFKRWPTCTWHGAPTNVLAVNRDACDMECAHATWMHRSLARHSTACTYGHGRALAFSTLQQRTQQRCMRPMLVNKGVEDHESNGVSRCAPLRLLWARRSHRRQGRYRFLKRAASRLMVVCANGIDCSFVSLVGS